MYVASALISLAMRVLQKYAGLTFVCVCFLCAPRSHTIATILFRTARRGETYTLKFDDDDGAT